MRRAKRGTTLIEMVVASSIGLMILGMTWKSLSTITKGVKSGEIENYAASTGAIIIARIQRDLDNMDTAAMWPEGTTSLQDLQIAPDTPLTLFLLDGSTVTYEVDSAKRMVKRKSSLCPIVELGKGRITGGAITVETVPANPVTRRVSVSLTFEGNYVLKKYLYPVQLNRMLLYSFHYLSKLT